MRCPAWCEAPRRSSRFIPSNSEEHPHNRSTVSQTAWLGSAPKCEQGYVVLQLVFLAAVKLHAFEKSAREILEHQRLRQSAQSSFRKPQEATCSELLPLGRANFGGAIGERQNHVAVVQPHALLVVGFTRDESQRKAL